MKMPFGKYKGEDVGDVPESYLLWCLDNVVDLAPTLRREIKRVLGLTEDDTPRPALSVDLVGEWHRKMALRFHPDHGGNHAAMVAVNVGRELLLEMAR